MGNLAWSAAMITGAPRREYDLRVGRVHNTVEARRVRPTRRRSGDAYTDRRPCTPCGQVRGCGSAQALKRASKL
ncbi:hypothetical protein AG1IA_05985 [Rhizoctonia solani AG-1 IA]|uniref:Uncharacterized protein n=1 Tax=Thanatephorus cucumeris (strain AG1-IA) TaxID=983506 RepID=L8WP96_THACA|nr:hypothetical protein AG1IA_05985 [Rhizoctonia solani AG-1 IA]